ncbi:MAG: DUF2628 domain-containing protein [Parvibaculum sp.]|uniref:DUF2628 domain-containing protein n=1 Tax=Parvibaculum sp. TaxID=2024848 RepID=UPI0025EA57A5|nr:DUF2628 domain-containing protein [Parvibaculum sp.]MCE9648095.1 DUF2628 domain-containing protein [Parvibaculum sp.]
MRIYTVHELAGAPADGKGVVFVREGFSAPALVFTVLWLAFERLWLALVFYVAAMIAVAALAYVIGNADATLTLTLALHVLLGVSANDIRRWTLARNGYRDVGVAGGRTLEEAERDFFRRWNGPFQAAPASPSGSVKAPVWPRRPEDHGALGLFPRAGG